jgi:glutamate-1-semialdehyde 2,1-aminomutase
MRRSLLALGTARAVTGREKLMAFEGCYHGSFFTFAGKLTPFNAPFPVVLAPYNDTEKTLALIEANASELAAIMVEPLVGGGGCIPADPEFLKALRHATAKHGILLIFDEVMTSRLGPGGLQQEYGVIPDMMSLGKYVGGGITFGAFGGRADIMARFDPRRPDAFPHNGTYNNNVLTMMAGIAGLKEVFTPEAAIRINADGDAMRQRLNATLAKHGVPGEVTGRGSMMAIHFGKGPFRRPADVAKVPGDVRALYHFSLMEQALYVSRRGMLVLSLPMTQVDRDAMVTGFDRFLGTYKEVITKVL